MRSLIFDVLKKERSEPKVSTTIVLCVSAFEHLARADEHRHGSMKLSHTCARSHSQLQWFAVARCVKVEASTSTWINTCARSITGDPQTADSFIFYLRLRAKEKFHI